MKEFIPTQPKYEPKNFLGRIIKKFNPFLTIWINPDSQPKLLPNQKLGKLTLIKKINQDTWLCKCDCGKITKIDEVFLLSGITNYCSECKPIPPEPEPPKEPTPPETSDPEETIPEEKEE